MIRGSSPRCTAVRRVHRGLSDSPEGSQWYSFFDSIIAFVDCTYPTPTGGSLNISKATTQIGRGVASERAHRFYSSSLLFAHRFVAKTVAIVEGNSIFAWLWILVYCYPFWPISRQIVFCSKYLSTSPAVIFLMVITFHDINNGGRILEKLCATQRMQYKNLTVSSLVEKDTGFVGFAGDVKLMEAENERNRQAYSDARHCHGCRGCNKSQDEDIATDVWIRAAFQGYLAKREMRAFRGLLRLQTLMGGHSLKQQAADTLQRMQTTA